MGNSNRKCKTEEVQSGNRTIKGITDTPEHLCDVLADSKRTSHPQHIYTLREINSNPEVSMTFFPTHHSWLWRRTTSLPSKSRNSRQQISSMVSMKKRTVYEKHAFAPVTPMTPSHWELVHVTCRCRLPVLQN